MPKTSKFKVDPETMVPCIIAGTILDELELEDGSPFRDLVENRADGDRWEAMVEAAAKEAARKIFELFTMKQR